MRGKSYQYNINNNTVSCIQELKLPETAEINEDQFSVETRFVKSHDNQEIPTVFVTPKIPSSLSPILLSSYGCYGVPNPIQYTPYYISLLKRGWSLGYPCIRYCFLYNDLLEVVVMLVAFGMKKEGNSIDGIAFVILTL